jgi:SAM-dependent methyltransferase
MTTEITKQNEVYGTFSERFPILYDKSGRIQKALKIVAVIDDFCQGNISHLRALDVGGSAGAMTDVFADAFAQVVELDIDLVAVRRGRADSDQENLAWICGNGARLPFRDETFDCVICNHVYEHLDDQQGLADEIHRVLRPDGFCYFGAGSRFVPVEGHYKLPLLSWFPHRVSDVYMRLCGRKGHYDVTLLSYRKLKKLLTDFRFHDYTIPILKHPDRFHAADLQERNRLAFRIPVFVYRLLYPILPIWVWILTKK